jgi:[ribosomal protein S5]-alanine N-acetyltransferase
MIPFDTIILSRQLRLRRFSKADIPFVFSASRFPGFCDGMRWDPPNSENELLVPYEANERAWETGVGYTFTIEKQVDAQLLGRIAIRRQDSTRWDLGFWTHTEHQGKGYMTESVVALIDFGFTQLDALEIQAAHATWNKASKRVLEKAGLYFVRHIPQGFEKRGIWVEEDLLAISREQWKQQAGQAFE